MATYKLVFAVDRNGKRKLVDIVFQIPEVKLPELKEVKTFWTNKNETKRTRTKR